MITLLFVLFWGSDPLIPSMNQSIGYDIIIAQPGTWQHLGTRKVNRRLDRDIIPVTIRDGLFTKITKRVRNEAELLKVYEKAKLAGLNVSLIKDMALTELKEPAYTAIAIGPNYIDKCEPVVKRLQNL